MKKSIFEYMDKYGHEQLVFCRDKKAGLKAIIALHDTTLGPAAGGTRLWAYDSEEDAIVDALRLSQGMTHKYAAAGINLGGGKTVVIIESPIYEIEKGKLTSSEKIKQKRPVEDYLKRLGWYKHLFASGDGAAVIKELQRVADENIAKFNL